MKKLSLSFVFASLLAVPFVTAVEHSVASDLSSFVQAFRSIFQGDVGGFTHHLVQSLPVIGLVVIVYSLIYFITKLTLFRDDVSGKIGDTDKYAKAFAIGIALLGLAQQSVYNAILNWSRLFLTFSFIIAVIAMASLFYIYWRKRNFEDQKDRLSAKKDYLPVKHEVKKLEHDLKMQEKTYKTVDSDLAYLKSDLHDLDKLSGDEKRQVEKLISLIARASSAKKIGNDEEATQKYSHVLSSGIHKLIATMQHEPSHIRHLEAVLHEVETKLSSWGRNVNGDIKEVTHDEALLKRHLRNHHGAKDPFEINQYKDDELLQRHLRDLRSYLHELESIEKRMIEEKQKIVKHTLHDKFNLAEGARSAIHTFDYNGAERYLRELHTIIQSEDVLIEKLRQEDMAMKSVLSNIEHVERKLRRSDLKHLVKDASRANS